MQTTQHKPISKIHPSGFRMWHPVRLSHVAGGVTQWLERRSLAGGLSLIYAWSMVDIWPLCG